MGLSKWDKIDRWVKINEEQFKKNFTKFRVNEWLSITKACDKVGISTTIYNRILNWHNIDPSTIVKIRKFIEVELS